MFFEYDYEIIDNGSSCMFELIFPKDIYTKGEIRNKYNCFGFPEYVVEPIKQNLSELVHKVHIDDDEKCMYVKMERNYIYNFFGKKVVFNLDDIEVRIKLFKQHECPFKLIEYDSYGTTTKEISFLKPKIFLFDEFQEKYGDNENVRYDMFKIIYEKKRRNKFLLFFMNSL